MKPVKIMLFLILIVTSVNLCSGVKINSLSSYFDYLIEDVETDSELFPSHISEYGSKFIQYLNSGKSYPFGDEIHLSILPIYGSFSWKITIMANSNNLEPSLYLSDNEIYRYYRYRYNKYFLKSYGDEEYGYAALNNQFAFNISDNLKIGCFIEYDDQWIDEIFGEKSQYYSSGVDIIEETYESDFDYYQISSGLNISFGSNVKTDITLQYSQRSFAYNFLYEHLIEDTQINSYYERLQISSWKDISDYSQYDKNYAVAILVQNKGIRYFFQSNYIVQDYDDYGLDRDEITYNFDGVLDSYSKHERNNTRTEDRKLYLTKFGFGKNYKKNKWEFYNGIKILADYIETDRYEFENRIEITIEDSTFADTTSYSTADDYLIQDWTLAIQLPVGLCYQINDIINVHGGIGLQVIRQELEYLEDDEFKRWGTESEFNFGVTIEPMKKLKIDLNFNGSVADYRNWLVDVKYLW